MLREKKGVRQIDGEGFRRWFTDKNFDLIVWYEDENSPSCIGFQLCYDKEDKERALTWSVKHGYSHTKVDDGEAPYTNKMTPILVSDGLFDGLAVREQFLEAAGELDGELTRFIDEKLKSYE